MPLDLQDVSRWPELLRLRLPENAGAEQMAAAVVDVWTDIESVLHPIVGHRGVAALYHRALKLSLASHPWLSPAHPGLLADMDREALRTVLVGQSPARVTAGAIDHLESFCTLLAGLVGPSLTTQLLAPVWASSEGEPPTQDMPS